MNHEKRINELEKKIQQLESNVMIMENMLISKVPNWAKEPLNKAQEKGEIPYPYLKEGTFGSYDYYRILALLAKNKLI